MTSAISPSKERMLRSWRAVQRVVEQVEAIEEQASGVWRSLNASQRRALENIERFHKTMEIIDRVRREMHVVRVDDHLLRRGQNGAAGTGKKSTSKKSAKSASGSSDGGDGGGGDGDGPPRALSKSKKPRSKTRSINSAHPPSIPTGEITSPQFPPPQSPSPLPRQGRGLITYLSLLGALYIATTAQNEEVGIIVFGIIALCVTGHSDVAKTALTSKAITALVARLSGKGGGE